MKYTPHPYQEYCIDYLLSHPAAGLFLKPGMGKTSVALTAADRLLYDTFEATRALVIAPLRVAEDTWSRESEKWDHLRHLRVSRVLGDVKERRAALRADADIYCINRENVDWLVKLYGTDWPFDLVIVDELSSFRNPSARRFRALRKVRPLVKYLWGLTGTPRPRSLLDLWAQVYLLDRGERLGRTFTEYKRNYFSPGRRNGYVIYEWVPRPGAEDEIYGRISDICISLETKGNLQMPELVETVRPVKLSPEARSLYDSMEPGEALLKLVGTVIDAGSAAAVNGKLLQIAGGAVYDEDHVAHELHTEKLDVLEDVLEEAAGSRSWWPTATSTSGTVSWPGSPQAVQLKDRETIAAWNRGEIPLLLVHPAGAGHGLNLQDGGHIIVWFGPIYDLELWEQTRDRLYRQGQRSTTSMITLVVEGTVEEDAMRSLAVKDDGQTAMMEAIKARIKKLEDGVA